MADLFLVPAKVTDGSILDEHASVPVTDGFEENNNDPVTVTYGLPPDFAEREKALEIERSWIVEAPAGSGKTGLLIQRYLKLLGHESVETPEQVLAITFTKDAIAEIRERVMGQLESAARGEALKGDGEFARETRALAETVLRRDELLGWRLLESPRRLRVQTIDSVCAEVARSLPVLSGGGGKRTVEDATPMYREAARRTLMQMGGQDAMLDDALRLVLVHRDGNLAECERLIVEMLPLRDQWAQLVPLGRTELEDAALDGAILPLLNRALERVVCAGLTEFAEAVPRDFLEALCSLAVSLAEIEPYERERSPVAACAGRVGLPGTDAADLEHWRALVHLLVTPSGGTWRKSFAKNTLGFETTPHQKKALKGLLEEVAHRADLLVAIERVNRLPPATYPEEQWVVAKALFRVLSRALAELQVVFAERGECDFAEMSLLAGAALEYEGGVRDLSAALGVELRHLLVDEMQDTSTGQYRLIELLTQGWDGYGQTVFLVGDPKQSIYLFRQARVERFVRTMQTKLLGEMPLGCLQLTANFRSQRELVETFNTDFSLLFPREVRGGSPEEVAYVEAQAVNGASEVEGLGEVWHTRVLAAGLVGDEGKRQRRRAGRGVAREVREIVERWRGRPLPEGRIEPWKMAVLVRSRGHLMEVVEALKEGAIPFRAVKIEPLRDRQEVLDLWALTRALLHPADRVAWLGVLRAPWCGLGLAELHVLVGRDEHEWAERCVQDVIDERGDLLSEDGCARLAKVWPVLRAAAEQRGRLTVAQWVERTWRSLGGDASLTADEMANARRYLELLDEAEALASGLDLGMLKRKIDALYAETAGVEGAVDLMTIHGAKGLEWDVVMVPGLEKRARVTGSRLLSWSEIGSGDALGDEAGAQVMLAPIAGKGEGSRELNQWLNGIHHGREAAERKRLFYVACTRAREELHLFAAPQESAKGEVIRAAGSLLGTAWPAAQRQFVTTVPEGSSGAGGSGATAQMFVMSVEETVDESFVGDIAAGAEEVRRPAVVKRLPLGFDARARFHGVTRLSYGEVGSVAEGAQFARPEGSFEARALGNAVHAFLEVMAKRLGEGVRVSALLEEVAGWGPRIGALLRGDGLARGAVERNVAKVMGALGNVLRDEEGVWVLGRHAGAMSEFALTSWGETRSSVRLDRVFRAGAEPMMQGEDCLWILDYKTTDYAGGDAEGFLAGERVKYGAQMEAYARVMGEGRVRVGLYYPMLPRLAWWVLG